MAILYSYPIAQPALDDLLLGTQTEVVNNEGNFTKSFNGILLFEILTILHTNCILSSVYPTEESILSILQLVCIMP